ncbi:tensin-3 isoform X1 [Tachysurus ichikawai]
MVTVCVVADQALDRFAMRKFYDDKVSAMMTPSQKRYVWILNSLLSGSMKMNTSPLFLHCIILHGIPNFDNSGVCRPFIKVYQGMQAVYASGVYHIGPGHRHKVCIALEPAQLLKGDIMVKCFHKSSPSQRDLVFRLQFHTGAVQGYSLMFEKEDMEQANKDPRFPDYGKVELVFSEGPERSQGADIWQNGADVSVDYSSTDSLNRWDSYQDVCNGEECWLDGDDERDDERWLLRDVRWRSHHQLYLVLFGKGFHLRSVREEMNQYPGIPSPSYLQILFDSEQDKTLTEDKGDDDDDDDDDEA